MAKDSIRDYSASSSDNSDIQSVDISEGCAPSGLNNAIREVMADLKDVSAGTVALETPVADTLGVGTTSPARTFSVESADAIPSRIKSTEATSSVEIGDSTGSIKIGSGSSGDIKFFTGGDTSFANHTETVTFPSTGGITFNGDTAAENALDYYEEGTWTLTPADSSGNNSSTTIDGKYTKIGNVVHVWCPTITNMVTSNMVQSTSEILRMTGLPFAATNANFVGSINMNNLTFDTGKSQISATTVGSGNYFRIMKQGSGVNVAFATPSDCVSGNTDFINLTMTYMTDS